MFFMYRAPEEPAAYWSAPREHLSFEQLIAYRGLSPQTIIKACVHEHNGDTFNMLVELAVDLPYAVFRPNTPAPVSSSTQQPVSSPSIPSSSSPSSVPSVSPPLEETLH